MGLAPTGVWSSPPYPIVAGGPFTSLKPEPLPSPPSPSLFPPTPLGSFCKAPASGRGRPRRGPRAQGGGGGGAPSGTWGQIHIWGHSNVKVTLLRQKLLLPPKGPRRTKDTTRSKFTTRSIFSAAG